MSRGESPMQAKAKRRQSDAKWRASVATCYDTLKYVVPNVKNMTKRKVSKALILQESEKHIKELEAAMIHLLGTESKKRGKAVLWEEDSVWSGCTLDKLREDFAKKQQDIFHMAVNGRRCYNLLQDIKEDVFAMEAEPSRLSVVNENSQAMSSLLAKLHTLKASSYAKEGAQPIQRINLVLSGPSSDSGQQIHAGVVKNLNQTGKRVSHSETTVRSQAVTSVSPRASEPLSILQSKLPKAQIVSHFDDKLDTSQPDYFSACSSPAREDVLVKSEKEDCAQVAYKHAMSVGSCKAFSAYSISNSQYNPSGLKSRSKQDDVKESSQGNLKTNPISSSTIGNTHRLKIHVEYVNGNFYLVSGDKNSTIHLIKTTTAAPARATSASFKRSAVLSETEEFQEQEVPSMKLPVKRPVEDVQEESKISLQNTTLIGVKQLSSETNYIKQIQTPSASIKNVSKMSDDHSEKGFYSDKRNKVGFFTVSMSRAHKGKLTAGQVEKGSPNSLDIKEENMETYTPRNNQDPLLSSKAISKPDDSTPLFMRTENDMVIKRPPKLGSARKKLNFGQSHHMTPDKQDSNNAAGKGHLSAGGFTPVKLPNEFGMVPDEDGQPMGSLISPWKIVDSPSYAHSSSSQNCMVSGSLLDMDNNLMCLETLDTMDLNDELDSKSNVVPMLADDIALYSKKTNKRKVSQDTPKTSMRQQPKCRRKLEKFYEGTSLSNLEKHDVEADSSDNQFVPEIYRIANVDSSETHAMEHGFYNIQNEGEKLKQITPKGRDWKGNIEENHVVPDSCIKSNNSCSNNYDLLKQECSEPASPGNGIFYSSSDCDDFDGFYYYYQLMRDQLRQEVKTPTTGTTNIMADDSKCSNVTSPTEDKTLYSSPAVATKIAHMWSCLPLQDKLTMATLASLEERQSQRNAKSPTSLYHQDIMQHKSGLRVNKLKITDPFNHNMQQGDVGNLKLKFSPNLDLLNIDLRCEELSKKSHASVSDKSSIHCKSVDFYSSSHSHFDTDQNCKFIQDSVSENIEKFDVDKCLQGLQDEWKVPKVEHLEGIDIETHEVFDAQDVLKLGELSPDLQEVEVQPLFDHTYDHTIHID